MLAHSKHSASSHPNISIVFVTFDLQAEEAEQTQDWARAEKLYAEATFIDTAASLINTALWLGLCRTRWHLQMSEASVEACDNTLNLQPDDIEAIKYKASVSAADTC